MSYLKDDWKPSSEIAQKPGRRANDRNFLHIIKEISLNVTMCSHVFASVLAP